MEPNQQSTSPQTAPVAPVDAVPVQQPAVAPVPIPTPISATPQPLAQPGQAVPGVTPQPPIATNGTPQQPTLGQPPTVPSKQQGSRTEQMQSNKRLKEDNRGVVKKDRNTAQNSLLISEIRDNMVIMNDGSFRAVIACQSINFDLMSAEERDGIEYSYQNFLNSLYFPIQISVGSRRVDLSDYIQKLEGIRREQDNLLLGQLTDDYLDFIFDISQQANLMKKRFLVIVPYFIGGDIDSAVTSLKSIRANLLEDNNPTKIKISASDFAKAKEEISNRVNVILSGMTAIGIQAGQLPTKALAELYYNFYNPDTAVNQPIADFKNYIGNLYIKKGEGTAPNLGGIQE